MFDQIEKLKQEYTDRYVVVDGSQPELARFQGFTGRVKTVNMSGRALVEFDAWNNIGWYDIDVDYLKVVPKPEPKVEEPEAKKVPAKPKAAAEARPAAAGEKRLSPLELARQQGAAKKPAGAAPAATGTSTADILAAARAGKKTEAVASATAPEKPAAKPGTDKPAAGAGPKLSTADILAAARANKAAAAASAPAQAPPAKTAGKPPEAEPSDAVEETPAAATLTAATPKSAAPAKPAAKPSAPVKASGERPSVTEILAWCREHDAK